MITPAYVRTMAAYNATMNRAWYAAAATLTDDQRRENRGAFFGSIHGTLNHLIWGDHTWMSRFAGWEKPAIPNKDSPTLHAYFDALRTARVQTDADLTAWAETVDQAWLDQDLSWYSGSTQQYVTAPHGLLVAHMFNHQTHHRGQAHALLTSFGADPGITDLPFVL
jgi:uncharacterized damage-inducible protein DinB